MPSNPVPDQTDRSLACPCGEPVLGSLSVCYDHAKACGECGNATDERLYDAHGRPLCFICGLSQSAHPGGIECSLPSDENSTKTEASDGNH